MINDQKNVHQLLSDFQQLWDDSLNENYHPSELENLAKEINLCYASMNTETLSHSQRLTLHHALIIAHMSHHKSPR